LRLKLNVSLSPLLDLNDEDRKSTDEMCNKTGLNKSLL